MTSKTVPREPTRDMMVRNAANEIDQLTRQRHSMADIEIVLYGLLRDAAPVPRAAPEPGELSPNEQEKLDRLQKISESSVVGADVLWLLGERLYWKRVYLDCEMSRAAAPADDLCARLRVIAAWLAPGGAWPVSVETLEIASREILNATDIIGAIATKQELLHRQLDNLQSAVEYWRAGRETSP